MYFRQRWVDKRLAFDPDVVNGTKIFYVSTNPKIMWMHVAYLLEIVLSKAHKTTNILYIRWIPKKRNECGCPIHSLQTNVPLLNMTSPNPTNLPEFSSTEVLYAQPSMHTNRFASIFRNPFIHA